MTSKTEAGVSAAQTDRKAARDASFPMRVGTAVVALPLLYLLAKAGGIAWLLFTVVVLGLSLGEFYRMMESKGLTPHWKSGTFAVLLLPIGGYLRLRTDRVEEWHLGGFLTVLVGAVLLAELRRGAGKQAVANTASTLLGVLYIGWLGTHIGLLRELPGPWHEPYANGVAYALLPFFLAWTCDTAAYGVGLAFGRHKLMPDVSPGKSVEGALAGFAAAIGAAWVARAWFAPFLTAFDAWALGALAGVFGQLGDLVESLLKRDAETKDASRLIPGHGGVLDRFDSILFVAPVVYYYLLFQVVGK